MMAQWTNDQWISTMHRVLPPGVGPGVKAQRRMALTFFLIANYDVVIEPLATCWGPTTPPKYAPVTAWEHLVAKLSRQFSREGNEGEESRERMAQQGREPEEAGGAPIIDLPRELTIPCS